MDEPRDTPSPNPVSNRPNSPADTAHRGLESLHDGKEHPTEGDVLPPHDPEAAPSPGEAHRGGPLPNEKK